MSTRRRTPAANTRHLTPGTCRAGRVLFLALLLIAAGPGQRAPATCRCGSGALEVVLVLDTTSSMHVMIGTVKEQLYRLMAALEGGAESLRVGAVVYRSPEAPEYVTRAHPLTADRQALVTWIRGTQVRGGGYEAVEKGLERALEEMNWSKGARKVIILVGDEDPHPDHREACVKLARLAKSRGIVLNAITCSLTAWSYWRLVHTEEWDRMYRERGERAKSEFQLPLFKELAREGGGVSVPTADTDELLKWLLVLASGTSDPDSVKVEKFRQWEAAEESRGAGRNPMLAQLRYRGEWNTPRNFEALRAALEKKVRLDFDSGREVVTATARELAGRPLVYVTGHGVIDLRKTEKQALREYLESGGMLWADCCCARPTFDAAIRGLVAELFPGRRLAPLPPDHPVFRAGYDLKDVRRARRPRTRGTDFVTAPARLEGLSLGGRLAVIYSQDSLGCGWASYPLGAPCQLHDADAVKMSTNILLYALTSSPRGPGSGDRGSGTGSP